MLLSVIPAALSVEEELLLQSISADWHASDKSAGSRESLTLR